MALSDIAADAGIHCAEFVVWGDADTAIIGISQFQSSLDQSVGSTADSIGWRLDTGEVLQGGSAIATGLPIPEPGEHLGILLDLASDDSASLTFMRGQTAVHVEPMTLGDAWHIAVSLGAPLAGDIRCFLNAGQNTFRIFVGQAGWTETAEAPGVIRLATEDYLSGPGDSPPNTRFEGVVAETGLLIEQGLSFVLWRPQPAVTVGKMDVHDAQGRLLSLIEDDWADAPVTVLRVDQGAPLSAAEVVGEFVFERADILDDGSKMIVLRDSLRTWDVPLQRDIYPPTVPALGYQPRPVLEGAVRSVPALIIPDTSDSELTADVSDRPLAGISGIRTSGDLLNPAVSPPDWEHNTERTGALLESPPVGVVTVDASTVGVVDLDPNATPVAPEDVFDGDGNPFAGTDGAAPTGWATGATDAGAEPTKETLAGQPNIGGLPVSTVCAFPNGQAGALKWIKLGQLQPGVPYRLILRAKLTNGGIVATPPLNPDFELGDTGWTKQHANWSIVSGGTRRGGQWSARFIGGVGPQSIENQIRVPVSPGQSISASCYINQLGASGVAAARIGLFWFDSGGAFITGTDVYGNLVNKKSGTGWHPSSVSASAPAGAAFVTVVLSANADSGRTIWVDDFTWSAQAVGQARSFAVATAPAEATFLATVSTTGRREIPLLNTTGAPQDVYLCCTCDGTGGPLDAAYLASAELFDIPQIAVPEADPLPAKLEPILSALASRRALGYRVEDAIAIDEATGYEGGGFWSQDAGLTVRAAFEQVLAAYCASIWQDDNGEIRVTRLVDPDGVDPQDWAFDLSEADLERDPEVTVDDAPGLSTTAWYRLNYRTLSRNEIVTDFDPVTGVPESVRQQLIYPGRGRVGSAVPIASRYRRAAQAAPMLLNFERREDAQAELDRRLALYSVVRKFYRVALRREQVPWQLGDVGRFTYPAHGLAAGRPMLLVRKARNPVTGELVLTLWGR